MKIKNEMNEYNWVLWVKNVILQGPATLVFIVCIINELKLHLSCSLADLLSVHCVACRLLY